MVMKGWMKVASRSDSCGNQLSASNEFPVPRDSAFLGLWNLKIDATIIVRFDGCRYIEIAHSKLLRASVEDPQRLSHDGVVGHFLFVAVAKYQHRWFNGGWLTCVCPITFPLRPEWGSSVFLILCNDGVFRGRQIDHKVQRLLGRRSGGHIGRRGVSTVIPEPGVECGNENRGDHRTACEAAAAEKWTSKRTREWSGKWRESRTSDEPIRPQRSHTGPRVGQERRDMEWDGGDRGRNSIYLGGGEPCHRQRHHQGCQKRQQDGAATLCRSGLNPTRHGSHQCQPLGCKKVVTDSKKVQVAATRRYRRWRWQSVRRRLSHWRRRRNASPAGPLRRPP